MGAGKLIFYAAITRLFYGNNHDRPFLNKERWQEFKMCKYIIVLYCARILTRLNSFENCWIIFYSLPCIFYDDELEESLLNKFLFRCLVASFCFAVLDEDSLTSVAFMKLQVKHKTNTMMQLSLNWTVSLFSCEMSLTGNNNVLTFT